jgi:hypothetical protein
MAQNTSHAVMAQRAEPHDSLDYFPTPPWATRALCEAIEQHARKDLSACVAWEPACGEGHMARPLAEYFGVVRASDVHDYGFGRVLDFLFALDRQDVRCDWIITNPPFVAAKDFALTALAHAREGVALLVRSSWLEGVGRHEDLFSPMPPSLILQFSERVPMVKGRLDRAASSATAYCWVVWLARLRGRRPEYHWIPGGTRARLERAEDYP